MSIDIKAISKSSGFDFTEFLDGVFSSGEIEVTSVEDLVAKVSQKVSGSDLRRLDIDCHGTSTSLSIGQTDISAFAREDRN